MIKPSSINEYIAGFPEETQKLLEQLRATVRKAAPEAEETISYAIPTFTFKGNLVHFAGYKNHIGFYPTPSGIIAYQKELSVYEGAKGSIKFPIDEPLPLGLISKIVKFRVKENLEKAAFKVKPDLRTCLKGHKYYKTAECLTCPICEQERKPQEGLLAVLSAPARRALENKGITTLQQLSKFSEAQVLALHGMGPGSIPKLRTALQSGGLSFKK